MPTDERMVQRAGRRRRSGLPAVVLAIALASLPVVTPAMARDQGAWADTVALTWTAPGDDGDVGTASVYQMRMSSSPIAETDWAAATPVSGLPVPLPAGTAQRTVVRGLLPGTTYYFAIRTADEAGNWSGLSNVVRWDGGLDTAPPAAPVGLIAVPQGSASVRLSWSPNVEADLAGYIVYRGLAAGGPFTALNVTPLTASSYVDGALPGAADAAWYQVAARDGAGNESARSATVSVSLATTTTVWAFRPVVPNPSGPGTPVRFRLMVPPAGGDARLEILNSIGQRVRRMELRGLTAGSPVFQWDGRNDAGREVAPGAYTAWLVAGTTRVSVRLVRVP